MKVFIENIAGSNIKHLFDEKKLELEKVMEVARPYPFPYGFLLNTTAPDGDNLDVFILTENELKTGQIIDCQPIGLMEQFELSWTNPNLEEIDHNILAAPFGETPIITSEIQKKLTDFVLHVFDNVQKNKTRVGRFLDKEAAMQYIQKHIML